MTEEQSIPDILYASVNPKPEKFKLNWLNIISFAIFLIICAWMLFHDPCMTCSVTYPDGNKVTCADIIGAYVNYSNDYVPVNEYVRGNFSKFNLSNLSASG